MKTLDEVITALEEAGDFVAECSYCSAKYCDKSYRSKSCYTGDALHYLKAYKEDRNELTALRAYWKEMHKDVRQKAEENDEDTE